MNCIKCGAEGEKLINVTSTERINEFGREELDLFVDWKNQVFWDPGKKLYICKICGGSFTFQEATAKR